MKIDIGEYYKAETGAMVGPMKRSKDGHYYVEGELGTWHADGRASRAYDKTAFEFGDLVEVWNGCEPVRTVSDDYATLRAILDDAYAQAASGKGKERHANDRPFLDQPICEIGRMLGSVCDGELYQAIKKAQEASNMLARHENKRAEAELLGAINYLAAAVILIRENMNDA